MSQEWEPETPRSWRRLLFGRLGDRPTRQTVLGATVGLGGLALGTAMLPFTWPAGLVVIVGSEVIALRIYRRESHSEGQNDSAPDY